MSKSIDLGDFTPEDVIYKNVKCTNGTCELILSGELSLKMVQDMAKNGDTNDIYFEEKNVKHLKDFLSIKTDPKIVEDAFKHIQISQIKKINNDLIKMISTADSKDIEIQKKN